MRKIDLLKQHPPQGEIMFFALILVLFIFMGAGALLSFSFERTIAEQRLSRIEDAREIAEAGIERAIFELNDQGSGYAGGTETIEGGTMVISIVTNVDDSKTITSVATVQDQTITARAQVSAAPTTDSASFFYALHVGAGGVEFKNNATVVGNVVSDGSLEGAPGASVSQSASVSGTGNSIDGLTVGVDANVATLEDSTVGQDAKTTTITNSVIARDAYAASITHSVVGRDAYADSIKTSTVGGTTNPGSGIAPPASVPFPLSDELMDSWQTAAEAGGTIGTYTLINNTQASLGPVKINGDLVVNNGATLTVTGTIWVTGTITFHNGAILQLDPGYGTTSGILMASDPTNPTVNGKIVLENNVTVNGSGQTNSNVLLLSRFQGTGATAIDAANNSSSMTLYAPLGPVLIHNNFIVNSVSAYQLTLQNNAQVIYNDGLASTQFASGPGGAWQLLPGTVEIL